VSVTSPPASHRCASGLDGKLVSLDRARRVAETFSVLGDPSRVRIVHALSLSELCTSDLAAVVGMSESAVSHQLRTLRQLHVVRSRRDGKLVYYSLDDDHVRSLFEQGLAHAVEKEPR
jgi:DNA-binding transcriptional ArsR family regulator